MIIVQTKRLSTIVCTCIGVRVLTSMGNFPKCNQLIQQNLDNGRQESVREDGKGIDIQAVCGARENASEKVLENTDKGQPSLKSCK